MNRHLFAIIVLVCSVAAVAQTARPQLKLSTTVEDGKKSIVATLTLNGKPLEGSSVQFMIRRTFGNLIVGTDTTLDDGTAAVAFPSDLPADYDKTLDVIAVIKAPPQYASVSEEAKLAGGIPLLTPVDPFPRALWAPHAPWPLLLTIGILLAGVWITYAFTVIQVIFIKRGTAA
jgi:hypothetical protein